MPIASLEHIAKLLKIAKSLLVDGKFFEVARDTLTKDV